MAAKKDAATGEAPEGFQVFQKAGKTGEQIALNGRAIVAVESDGDGKFFVYVPGARFHVASEESLESLVGLPEAETVEK